MTATETTTMKITRGETISKNTEGGTRKAYRAEPGNFDAAARYAVSIAKRDGETVALVPGNSYGFRVFHIARLSDDLRTFTVHIDKIAGAIATPDGTVAYATLER